MKNNLRIFRAVTLRTKALAVCALFGFALLMNSCVDNDALGPSPGMSAAEEHEAIARPPSQGAAFYFLPPIAQPPEHSGTFNATLSPTVEIVYGFGFDQLHAVFSMTGTQSSKLTVDLEDGHYIARWNASRTEAEAGQVYRIRVRLGGMVLGYADAMVVDSANEEVPAGLIKLVASQALPIKFRIDGSGMICSGPECVAVPMPAGNSD